MLQLKNNTPFTTEIALFPNAQGIDTLYTIVKSTFDIGAQWTLSAVQPKPQQADVFWGEPNDSSLRYASDFHIGKASTDIIMSGMVCAPEQHLRKQMDAYVSVGDVSKTIRVFGDRRWDRGLISAPEPFVEIPLMYERAFGGTDIVDDNVRASEARNPVGRGFAGQKSSREMDGSFLPNFECPQNLIQSYQDAPAPACFMPIPGHWQPRASYAGTYDDVWQNTQAPYLPNDYSPRFMNCAHPDLISTKFLQGGEPVKIIGMHPIGELNFNLPKINLHNKIQMDDGEISFEFVLESVLLDPNNLQVSMVWRSAFECDKKALKIKQITVNMRR